MARFPEIDFSSDSNSDGDVVRQETEIEVEMDGFPTSRTAYQILRKYMVHKSFCGKTGCQWLGMVFCYSVIAFCGWVFYRIYLATSEYSRQVAEKPAVH